MKRRRGAPPSDDTSRLPKKFRPILIPQPPPEPEPPRCIPPSHKPYQIRAWGRWLAKTTEGFCCTPCVHFWIDEELAGKWASVFCPLCRRRARRIRTPAVNRKRNAQRLKERQAAD